MPRRLRRTTGARASLGEAVIKKAARRCHAKAASEVMPRPERKRTDRGHKLAIAERIRSPWGALGHLPGKSRNGPGRRRW